MTEHFDPQALVEAVAAIAFDEEGAGLDGYSADERESILEITRNVISAFTKAATERGVRFMPPGCVARPASDEEAAMMQAAVKAYAEAKRRKPGLIGSVSPALVLPGKLN